MDLIQIDHLWNDLEKVFKKFKIFLKPKIHHKAIRVPYIKKDRSNVGKKEKQPKFLGKVW